MNSVVGSSTPVSDKDMLSLINEFTHGLNEKYQADRKQRIINEKRDRSVLWKAYYGFTENRLYRWVNGLFFIGSLVSLVNSVVLFLVKSIVRDGK
jgi:hypothetical protein